jgi:hypothetical protein
MIRWAARYALRLADLAQPSPHWPSVLAGWQIRAGGRDDMARSGENASGHFCNTKI